MKKIYAIIRMVAIIVAGVMVFTVCATAFAAETETECLHENFRIIEVEMEPTCTSNGFIDHVKWCNDCKMVVEIEREYTSGFTPHNWSEWIENEDGTVATRHCLNCDATEEKPIEHEMTMYELGQTIRQVFLKILEILRFLITGKQ